MNRKLNEVNRWNRKTTDGRLETGNKECVVALCKKKRRKEYHDDQTYLYFFFSHDIAMTWHHVRGYTMVEWIFARHTIIIIIMSPMYTKFIYQDTRYVYTLDLKLMNEKLWDRIQIHTLTKKNIRSRKRKKEVVCWKKRRRRNNKDHSKQMKMSAYLIFESRF